ncbi:MAG: phosphopentomutase [Vicinamibacterales bacterium]
MPHSVDPSFLRVVVIVLDSVGIGELPDAGAYGDAGSNTVGHIAREVGLKVPTLRRFGLDRVVDLGSAAAAVPAGAYGRMAEQSPGKDSVTGHWELMGLVIDRPFPVFPHGFPAEWIAEFERRIGRSTLGNIVASGTVIIDELGPTHLETGAPIVYTSADSVFQVAAHEDIIPVAELYRICETAFDFVSRGHGVGRVIARPFVGTPGSFRRTANRHDYAVTPFGETLLDVLQRHGHPVVAIGKISDLFAARGIDRSTHTTSDEHGMDVLEHELETVDRGLILVNLVDSDTIYGHRNDVAGYGANLERIDRRLNRLLARLRPTDLLVVTADHGNDPTTPSTDHSREHVPVFVVGHGVASGVDLGTRRTFADLAQTLAGVFGVPPLAHGTSFLRQLAGG